LKKYDELFQNQSTLHDEYMLLCQGK